MFKIQSRKSKGEKTQRVSFGSRGKKKERNKSFKIANGTSTQTQQKAKAAAATAREMPKLHLAFRKSNLELENENRRSIKHKFSIKKERNRAQNDWLRGVEFSHRAAFYTPTTNSTITTVAAEHLSSSIDSIISRTTGECNFSFK